MESILFYIKIVISDFRDLGYEYDYYCGGRFIRCVDCDRLIRVKTNNKRCGECQEDADKERKRRWWNKTH